MTAATAVHANRSFALVLRQAFAAWPKLPSAPSERLAHRVPAASEQVRRELAAIRNYAHFLSKQSDMPSDHRERFLGQIIGSCDRAMAKLGTAVP